MKRRDWLISLSPLLLTWGLDRITKLWALETLAGATFLPWSPLTFQLHFNHAAMLGTFSNLPLTLRVVSLSTSGAFLIFVFAALQYLIPIRALVLRIGLSILLGGILGNVTDRILYGYVVDFFAFGTPSLGSPIFNGADVLQWLGYAMIFTGLARYSTKLWPDENARNKYLINPLFQIRYSLYIVSFGVFFALISGTLSYTYLRVTIIGRFPTIEAERLLSTFVITYVSVSLLFNLILFFTGIMLSQRVAGPIYAFERFLEDVLSGRKRKLKLRAGDAFKHLEKLADRVSEQVEPRKSKSRSNDSAAE